MPSSAALFDVSYVAWASRARTVQVNQRSPRGSPRYDNCHFGRYKRTIVVRACAIRLEVRRFLIQLRFQQLTLEVQCRLLTNGRL
jgi:hypothetical protein